MLELPVQAWDSRARQCWAAAWKGSRLLFWRLQELGPRVGCNPVEMHCPMEMLCSGHLPGLFWSCAAMGCTCSPLESYHCQAGPEAAVMVKARGRDLSSPKLEPGVEGGMGET